MEQPQHSRLLLLALVLAQLTICVDYSIVFVALPDIGSDLQLSSATLQWAISAYSVAFGGCLLLGGRLSDLVGRRRMLLGGLVLYAVSSLVGGLAVEPVVLVCARGVQGLGGAVMAPAALSLITSTFREGGERNRALAAFGTAGSSGMILGSLLGGVLTQAFGWSAVFFVNVPLCLGIYLLTARVVPADRPAVEHRRFDLPGAATITAGATLLVFALAEGSTFGWTSYPTMGGFVGALILIGAFVATEARTADPLVPLGVFAQRNLAIGTGIALLYMATLGTTTYFLTVIFQDVFGWSALVTGLAFIPSCALSLTGTIIGGRLSTLLGVRTTLVVGLGLGVAGTGLFAASIDTQPSWWLMVPGVVMFSLAQGIGFTAMFSAATAGVVRRFQGLAAGVVTSGQQIGAALGIALLVAVADSVDSAPGDPTDGLRLAAWVFTGIIAATIVAALALGRPPRAAHETEADEAAVIEEAVGEDRAAGRRT